MKLCFAKQLKRGFSSPLIGMQVNAEGVASLGPAHFYQCCKQECIRQLQTSPNQLAICAIEERLTMAQEILHKYKELNQGVPLEIARWQEHPHVMHFYRSLLAPKYWNARTHYQNPKGSIFYSGSRPTPQSPSPVLWTCAVVCTWRFGYRPYILALKHNTVPNTPTPSPTHPIVMIDQMGSLRNPTYAFQFAAQVKWCENALAPLWMDISSEQFQAHATFEQWKNSNTMSGLPRQKNLHQISKKDLNALSVVARAKVVSLKRLAATSPLDWANDFDSSCLARLESVAHRDDLNHTGTFI
ncbi:MAG: hypothetical protein OXT67_10910 [Zetaproteobacteria bacterium]|nr:hypothetical protein [Zetaproteobacteria bacterium]